ncbi:hypothetical protein P170DRAFT_359395, partial [Aspergillus steynii IBT 23096]
EIDDAYRHDRRSLDLPSCYKGDLEHRGFVSVVEHVYDFGLHRNHTSRLAREIIAVRGEGFEAYSLELVVASLEKRKEEDLNGCAAARQELRKGIAGSFQM